MAQIRKTPTAASGPRMTDAEATKCVKNYSGKHSYGKSKPVDMSQKAKNRRADEDYR